MFVQELTVNSLFKQNIVRSKELTFDLVYVLMKVPEEIEMEWGNLYHKYMRKASLIELSETDRTLKPSTKLCFKHLKKLID